ncbi:hypothetical protein BH10PSE7_BH10PSE7_12830 [soil metagenome]
MCRRRLTRAAAFACGLLASGSGWAADRPGLAEIRSAADTVGRLASSFDTSAGEIFEKAGVLLPALADAAPDPAAVEPASGVAAEPKLGFMPLELLFAQLASQTGADYHADLRAAQASPYPSVLVVKQGTATLTSLQKAVAGTPLQVSLAGSGDEVLLHVPLVIWSGATLMLEPGDRLTLDTAAGAFLVSAGRLIATGATIEGSTAANPWQTGFRPFIMVALSGSAELQSSTFRNLGYPDHPYLNGLSFVGGGLFAASSVSFVRNNRFDHAGSLALYRSAQMHILGNHFVASGGPAVLITGGDDLDLSRNIFAASRGYGVKVTAGADHIAIRSNIIVKNGSHGIFADNLTTHLSIRDNLIAGNDGAAVRVVQAACVDISGNAAVVNSEKGVSVEGSLAIGVNGNMIAANGGAGLAIAEQPAAGLTTVSNNVFAANRTGVSGLSFASLKFAGNDFRQQTPRLLAGELVQYTSQLLSSLADRGGDLSLTSVALLPAASPAFDAAAVHDCLEARTN